MKLGLCPYLFSAQRPRPFPCLEKLFPVSIDLIPVRSSKLQRTGLPRRLERSRVVFQTPSIILEMRDVMVYSWSDIFYFFSLPTFIFCHNANLAFFSLGNCNGLFSIGLLSYMIHWGFKIPTLMQINVQIIKYAKRKSFFFNLNYW